MENDVNPVPVENEQPLPPPGHRYDHLMPKKESGKKKILLLTLIGLVTLGVIAAAVYFFVLKKDTPTPAATDNQQATEQQPEAAPAPADSTPKVFKSTKLGLELTHRTDWSLKEDPDSGEITLTSPQATYTTKDGASKQAAFTLKFRQGATTEQQAAIKAAAAVLASETIAYSAPLETQRYYTNVTFGGQAEAISLFLVTGATQFKAGDSLANFFINGDTYVIGGGFGGTQPENFTFDTLPKASFTGSDTYKQALDIVKSLKIS